MIIMFVCDEDPIQTLRTYANGFESLGDLTSAEPGINEKPALTGGYQRTIACTSAAKDRQTEHPLSKAYSGTDANQITKEPQIRRVQTVGETPDPEPTAV
jgi:hypothetical protein